MKRSGKTFILIFAVLSVFMFIFAVSCGKVNDGESEKPTPIDGSEKGIKISQTYAEMRRGDVITLVTTDADGYVIWRSDNPKVASVNENGVVTANAVGAAVITARADNGSVRCSVEVKDNFTSELSAALNGSNIRLYPGDSYALQPSVYVGGEKVTDFSAEYGVSDASVIRIENGNIKAIGVGNATVYATVTAGDSKTVCSSAVTVLWQTDLNILNTSFEWFIDDEPKIEVQAAVYENGVKKDLTFSDLTVTIDDERRMFTVASDGSVDIRKTVLTESGKTYKVTGGEADLTISYRDYASKTVRVTLFAKKLTTAEEFRHISDEPSAYYIMMNDIDFHGASTPSLGELSGLLEGNGYSVKNVCLSDSQYTAGLFRKVSGTIRNLSLENIVENSVLGVMAGQVGLLAVELSGKVENVYLSGSMPSNIAANTQWADFRNWGWKAGFICQTATNAVINNVVLDVTTGVGTDISLICGNGNYSLGNVFAVRHEDGDPSSYGGSYKTIPDTTVEISLMTRLISASASVFDPSIWTVENGRLALIKGCFRAV